MQGGNVASLTHNLSPVSRKGRCEIGFGAYSQVTSSPPARPAGIGFISAWLHWLEVRTLFIEPGTPWENGYSESFNGKLRDKLLDREIFYTLREAQVLIEWWRQHYNGVRPHSALGYRPPAPEGRSWLRLALPPRSEVELAVARN